MIIAAWCWKITLSNFLAFSSKFPCLPEDLLRIEMWSGTVQRTMVVILQKIFLWLNAGPQTKMKSVRTRSFTHENDKCVVSLSYLRFFFSLHQRTILQTNSNPLDRHMNSSLFVKVQCQSDFPDLNEQQLVYYIILPPIVVFLHKATSYSSKNDI